MEGNRMENQHAPCDAIKLQDNTATRQSSIRYDPWSVHFHINTTVFSSPLRFWQWYHRRRRSAPTNRVKQYDMNTKRPVSRSSTVSTWMIMACTSLVLMNSPTPVTAGTTCSPVSVPFNTVSNIVYVNGTAVSATYTCNPGTFGLTVNSTCTGANHWNPPPSSCSVCTVPSLGDVPSAYQISNLIQNSGNNYSMVISCADGTFGDAVTSVCQHNAASETWYPPPPSTCSTCAPPAAPVGSLVLGGATNSQISFACRAGFWGPTYTSTCNSSSPTGDWTPLLPCTPCIIPAGATGVITAYGDGITSPPPLRANLSCIANPSIKADGAMCVSNVTHLTWVVGATDSGGGVPFNCPFPTPTATMTPTPTATPIISACGSLLPLLPGAWVYNITTDSVAASCNLITNIRSPGTIGYNVSWTPSTCAAFCAATATCEVANIFVYTDVATAGNANKTRCLLYSNCGICSGTATVPSTEVNVVGSYYVPPTPTVTPTPTASGSSTITHTASGSTTVTATATSTSTSSKNEDNTRSPTVSSSGTGTTTSTHTHTASGTHTSSATYAGTRSMTPSGTSTSSPTPTPLALSVSIFPLQADGITPIAGSSSSGRPTLLVSEAWLASPFLVRVHDISPSANGRSVTIDCGVFFGDDANTLVSATQSANGLSSLSGLPFVPGPWVTTASMGSSGANTASATITLSGNASTSGATAHAYYRSFAVFGTATALQSQTNGILFCAVWNNGAIGYINVRILTPAWPLVSDAIIHLAGGSAKSAMTSRIVNASSQLVLACTAVSLGYPSNTTAADLDAAVDANSTALATATCSEDPDYLLPLSNSSITITALTAAGILSASPASRYGPTSMTDNANNGASVNGFQVTLSGATRMTLVADAMGMFLADTIAYVDTFPCTTIWVSSDGKYMQVITPTLDAVCGAAIARQKDCAHHSFTIVQRTAYPTVDDTVALGSVGYTNSNEPTTVAISCPPACPGLFPTDTYLLPTITTVAATANTTTGFGSRRLENVQHSQSTSRWLTASNSMSLTAANATPGGLFMLPASYNASLAATLVTSLRRSSVGSSTSSRAVIVNAAIPPPTPISTTQFTSSALYAGIYYTPVCVGFPDPTAVDFCANASDPRSRTCAYGAGDACAPCPTGALCPGGFRLWPLPGYYTAAAGVLPVQPCVATATERCVGYDPASGTTQCGDGYAGVGCASCTAGYYIALDFSCKQCPAHGDLLPLLVPLFAFIAATLAFAGLNYGLIVAAVKLAGGTVAGGARRSAQLIVWIFTVVQLLAQVGKAAAPGLPPYILAFYQGLDVFQFGGLAPPTACLAGAYPFAVEAFQMSLVLALCLLVLALVVTVTRTDKHHRLSLKLASTPMEPFTATKKEGATISSAQSSSVSIATHPSLAYTASNGKKSGSTSTPSSSTGRVSIVPASWAAILSRWTPGTIVLRCAFITLTLVYPLVTRTVLSMIYCETSTVTVFGYLAMDGDGTSLRNAGITLPSASASDGTTTDGTVTLDVSLLFSSSLRSIYTRTLPVLSLASDNLYVCYEAHHQPVGTLAWFALWLYVVGYPLATILWVFAYMRRALRASNQPTNKPMSQEAAIEPLKRASIPRATMKTVIASDAFHAGNSEDEEITNGMVTSRPPRHAFTPQVRALLSVRSKHSTSTNAPSKQVGEYDGENKQVAANGITSMNPMRNMTGGNRTTLSKKENGNEMSRDQSSGGGDAANARSSLNRGSTRYFHLPMTVLQQRQLLAHGQKKSTVNAVYPTEQDYNSGGAGKNDRNDDVGALTPTQLLSSSTPIPNAAENDSSTLTTDQTNIATPVAHIPPPLHSRRSISTPPPPIRVRIRQWMGSVGIPLRGGKTIFMAKSKRSTSSSPSSSSASSPHSSSTKKARKPGTSLTRWQQAIDESPFMEDATVLAAWTRADYMPSRFYVRHIEFVSLVILACLLVYWQAPTSMGAAVGKLLVTWTVLAVLIYAFITLTPFPTSDWWKAIVKIFSLVLAAVAALLNCVIAAKQFATGPTDGGKSGGLGDAVVALSFIVFLMSIILFITLIVGFWRALLQGAAWEQRRRSLRASNDAALAAAVLNASVTNPARVSNTGALLASQIQFRSAALPLPPRVSTTTTPTVLPAPSIPTIGNQDQTHDGNSAHHASGLRRNYAGGGLRRLEGHDDDDASFGRIGTHAVTSHALTRQSSGNKLIVPPQLMRAASSFSASMFNNEAMFAANAPVTASGRAMASAESSGIHSSRYPSTVAASTRRMVVTEGSSSAAAAAAATAAATAFMRSRGKTVRGLPGPLASAAAAPYYTQPIASVPVRRAAVPSIFAVPDGESV